MDREQASTSLRYASPRQDAQHPIRDDSCKNPLVSDQAFVSPVLPLLQTNSSRPKRLFSARTFRATRCKARSARTTNAGVAWRFPFLAWLPFLFIPQNFCSFFHTHASFFFRRYAALNLQYSNPRLKPWATFGRCSAAILAKTANRETETLDFLRQKFPGKRGLARAIATGNDINRWRVGGHWFLRQNFGSFFRTRASFFFLFTPEAI